MLSLVKDDQFDRVLGQNMSVYETHVNNYYMSFRKLLDEQKRSYYNHEFLFILFDSARFKNLLLRLESIDRNFGYYEIERDFYWTGRVFKKCTPANDSCNDLVRKKLARTRPEYDVDL